MAWYITKLVVDLPWPEGGECFFVGFRGGGQSIFLVQSGGGQTFFFAPAGRRFYKRWPRNKCNLPNAGVFSGFFSTFCIFIKFRESSPDLFKIGFYESLKFKTRKSPKDNKILKQRSQKQGTQVESEEEDKKCIFFNWCTEFQVFSTSISED